jgi:hypothetical protein
MGMVVVVIWANPPIRGALPATPTFKERVQRSVVASSPATIAMVLMSQFRSIAQITTRVHDEGWPTKI